MKYIQSFLHSILISSNLSHVNRLNKPYIKFSTRGVSVYALQLTT